MAGKYLEWQGQTAIRRQPAQEIKKIRTQVRI
jgi:hypothetical protein